MTAKQDSATHDGKRRLLIAGNWKMNHTHLEAIQVVRKLCLRLAEGGSLSKLDVSIHPSFVALRSVQTVLESEESPISLGAQDCYSEDAGAFTGEVSAAMLAKLNVTKVIVGHSERRQIFREDDDLIRAKLDNVLKHRMVPILCVGETLQERESGETESRVVGQLATGLKGLATKAVEKVVIAYEPIWAIGTGRNATPEDAQSVCVTIRSAIAHHAGVPASLATVILYGGSVKPVNSAEIVSQADVDGLLVGGASLDPDEFAQVVSLAAECV